FEDNNDPDLAHPVDLLRSEFNGRLTKLDLQNALEVSKALTFVFGAETRGEEGNSTYHSVSSFGPFDDNFGVHHDRINGYYSNAQVSLDDRFFSAAGIRVDDHSNFGTKTTWRIAPAYLIKSTDTKLSATVGAGFKAPSLSQLYSSFGNPDLQPEKSLGV